jgi:hypothetical protein
MGRQKAVVTVAEAARELDGIRKAASMAGRAMARLENEAERIATSSGNAGRSVRMVSSEGQLSALIVRRHYDPNRGRRFRRQHERGRGGACLTQRDGRESSARPPLTTPNGFGGVRHG